MWRQLFFLLLIGLMVSPTMVHARSTYSDPGRQSLRTIPDTAPIEYLSASDLRVLGDTEAVINELRKAVRRYPHHESTLALYLKLMESTQGVDTAIQEAKRHLERVHDVSVLRNFFTEISRDTDRYAPLFEWMNQNNYLDSWVNKEYGKMLLRRGEIEKAENIVGRAVEKYYPHGELQLLYAEIIAELSRCDLALKHIREMNRQRPGWPDPYLLKARIYWSTQPNKARNALTSFKSLSNSSEPPPPRKRKAIKCR